MCPALTKTLVARLKRDAKARAKQDSISHSAALEQLAREAGFANWHAIISGLASASAASLAPYTTDPRLPALPTFLPIDPKLPRGFDATANDFRSARQLDEWWDRPYAIRQADGSLRVRCLDGGAHDRSTCYGVAKSEDEALELARSKLASWRLRRERPMVYVDDAPGVHLVQMPQRPDWEMLFLLRSVSQEEVRTWMDQHYSRAD